MVRADLVKGRVVGKRIVVLPDGPLVRLPFEALITGNDGRKQEYLLDADLPITYSPSGTILVESDKRPSMAPVRGKTDVCFVGKSDFSDQPGNWAYNNGDFGGLPRLPRAADAGPTTFPGIFGLAGLKVDIRNENAVTTEKQVAEAIQQTSMVLFSTHGLGGGETISSFGALVLTRPQAVKTLDDDGMFTYEEICECDLRGCELAIHTACDTNVGPNQRGEAAWAVSRGFLVAGSCRVLATQWNAEDSASGEFSAELARRLVAQLNAQQDLDLGRLDYARAVHEAKLDLRRHAIYGETPVLWAPWVLIGSK
jgi:CHAT domain-containing protein